MNSTAFTDCDGTQCEYGRAAQYGLTFIDQMNCLYLLAYLVTADRHIAEGCLMRALDEYVDGRIDFPGWSHKEGRRAVLREAIRIITPQPKQVYWWIYGKEAHSSGAAAYQPFAAITSLSAFERFVFVICTIEGFSEEETAGLLNCTLQDVAIGLELARRIVDTREAAGTGDVDVCVVPIFLGNQVCGHC